MERCSSPFMCCSIQSTAQCCTATMQGLSQTSQSSGVCPTALPAGAGFRVARGLAAAQQAFHALAVPKHLPRSCYGPAGVLRCHHDVGAALCCCGRDRWRQLCCYHSSGSQSLQGLHSAPWRSPQLGRRVDRCGHEVKNMEIPRSSCKLPAVMVQRTQTYIWPKCDDQYGAFSADLEVGLAAKIACCCCCCCCCCLVLMLQ